MDYVFKDKTNLVNYLYQKLNKTSPIKVQKTLYFLFAFYGATYGSAKNNRNSEENEFIDSNYPQYLFEPKFEAWMYGPVDSEVYGNAKQDCYSPEELDKSKMNKIMSEAEKENIKIFIDGIISQTTSVDDFTLVDRTHEDKAWKNVYEEGKLHLKMDPTEIINEYSEDYV